MSSCLPIWFNMPFFSPFFFFFEYLPHQLKPFKMRVPCYPDCILPADATTNSRGKPKMRLSISNSITMETAASYDCTSTWRRQKENKLLKSYTSGCKFMCVCVQNECFDSSFCFHHALVLMKLTPQCSILCTDKLLATSCIWTSSWLTTVLTEFLLQCTVLQ